MYLSYIVDKPLDRIWEIKKGSRPKQNFSDQLQATTTIGDALD